MADEAPRRLECRRGSSVAYRGKVLASRVDPVAAAEKAAAAAPRRQRTLYFCPSPLFGYGLAALLGELDDHSAVVAVEADPVLAAAVAVELDAAVVGDGRLLVLDSADPAEACARVRRRFGARRFRRLETVRLNSGWQLEPAAYAALEAALAADIGIDWSNAATLIKLGRRFALNAVRNLGCLNAARPLDGFGFGDRPVLVCGAGPSLDAVLAAWAPVLGAPGRPAIVAVDTALGPLLERGLVPDLAVVLEAQHWNLRDFVGVSRRRVPLAVDLASLPASVAAAGGDFAFTATRWTPLRWFDRLAAAGLIPPELPPLGSVGLAAVALARRLSRGPILAAGLDFAYTQDAYHARSTPTRLERLRRHDRLAGLVDPGAAYRRRVNAVAGPWRADPALAGYRALFRREFPADGRTFDLSPSELELGWPKLDPAAWPGLLRNAAAAAAALPARPAEAVSPAPVPTAATVAAFIAAERGRLERLRAALTGEAPLGRAELEDLVDDCDYLWAHFPECAGAEGGRPRLEDAAFLKRTRVEIDPFLKAYGLAAARLGPATLPSS
jgi:hypothetical protein